MRPLSLLLPLMLMACGGAREDASPETGIEADISEKAEDIRAQADTAINQQIADIDAAGNSERADLAAESSSDDKALSVETR